MTDTGVLRSIAEGGGDPTAEQVLTACDDLDALKADNARLRALVKEVEWLGCTGRDSDPACPWCGAEPEPIGNSRHAPEASGFRHPTKPCPAFTPDGEVK